MAEHAHNPAPALDQLGGRARRRPVDGLDDIDRLLVERLRTDGRESSRSLARAVGVNEVTVANRLRRLGDLAIMRVVAVVDMERFGYRENCMARITVNGRGAVDVAHDLAGVPEAISVSVCPGNIDIVVNTLARDKVHLDKVITGSFATVAGVDRIATDLAVEVLKYESKWGLLSGDVGVALEPACDDLLDGLDKGIVRLLQTDARQSNRRIAEALGVTEGTIRYRIKRLEEEGAICIQAISDVVAFGLGAYAYVFILCEPTAVAKVGQELVRNEETPVLMRTLGTADFVAIVHTSDRESLADLVLNQIATTPGVRSTETLEPFLSCKHSYNWARILTAAPPR